MFYNLREMLNCWNCLLRYRT